MNTNTNITRSITTIIIINNNVSLKHLKKATQAPLRGVTLIILTSNKTEIQNNKLQYKKHKTVNFDD
jgi:hypothetical protein